jgi:hypothetical protein
VREDVNLIDVLDFIADCVMAGMARSGSVYPLTLSPELLERAFQNTVSMLKAEVVVASASAPNAQPDGDQGAADDTSGPMAETLSEAQQASPGRGVLASRPGGYRVAPER